MEQIDYYEVLEVNRNATDGDINTAYQERAMQWHPDRNLNKEQAAYNFKEVSQAFEVLSDPSKRSSYDNYGYDVVARLKFQDPMHIFSNVFESTPLGLAGIKEPPIVRDFALTLEELYHGVTKKFNITRHVYSSDGTVTSSSRCAEIKVKAGWKAGTKITFHSEGDIHPGKIPSDIVFILKQKNHGHFKRVKDDLIYTAKITLKQALCGVKLNLTSLEGEQLTISVVDHVISPNFEKVIKGKGMPNSKTNTYGNLIVRFDIEFPKSLTKEQKKRVKEAFEHTK